MKRAKMYANSAPLARSAMVPRQSGRVPTAKQDGTVLQGQSIRTSIRVRLESSTQTPKKAYQLTAKTALLAITASSKA